MIDIEKTEDMYAKALEKAQETANQLRVDISQPGIRQLDRHILFIQRWADFQVEIEKARKRIQEARNGGTRPGLFD